MGTNTDDGFIIESRPSGSTAGAPGVAQRIIVLALDEDEALQIAERDAPGWQHKVVVSGQDIRSQAARLGVEPGTSQQIKQAAAGPPPGPGPTPGRGSAARGRNGGGASQKNSPAPNFSNPESSGNLASTRLLRLRHAGTLLA